MNIKIEKADLGSALRNAGMIRPDKVNIIPAAPGKIIVNASEKGHGGVVTQSVVECVVEGSGGAFQLPYANFRAVIDSMPDGVLDIRPSGPDAVTVRNGRTRLKTRALFDAAVDALSIGGASARCELGGKALRQAIGRTSHAMAEKDPRAFLNTLRLEISQGLAEVVATDGRRLMLSRFNADTANHGGDIAVTVVNTAVPLLAAMAEAGDVAINLIGKTVVIERGEWLCRVPVIEGYPNWRKVMGGIEPSDPQCTVDATTMLAAMRRMIVVGDGESNGTRFGCLIRATTTDDGAALRIALAENESEDVMAVESGAGDIDMGLDARQIADALSAISAGKLRLVYLKGSNGVGNGRLIIVPDENHDLSVCAFASTITECRI